MRRLERAARRLTQRELGWARLIFEAMFPAHGSARVDLAAHVRDTTRALPISAVLALRGALAIVAVAPSVRARRLTSWREISPVERLACLESLAGSEQYLFRSMFTLLKTTAALAYASSTRCRTGVFTLPSDR